MDPVSALAISSSCMTLATKSGNLIMRIIVFVSEVRNARKDLDAISRELTSLQLCLSALKDDQQLGSLNLPDAIKTQVNQILVNIDLVFNQITDILIKLSSGKLGRRIQWATTQKDEMNKFRSSLESNKTALEIALTMGSISILSQQMQNSTRRDSHFELLLQRTESISLNTRTIDGKLDVLTDMHKDNTRFDLLVQEINSLRAHMTNLSTVSGNTTLDTFKANSEAYTQSLLQPLQAKLPDSGAAVLDLSSRPTSVTSQLVSCNCEDIFRAKEQEFGLVLAKCVAEYETLHNKDMVKLQESEKTIAFYEARQQNLETHYQKQLTEHESLHSRNSVMLQEQEKSIASYHQQCERDHAENARLQTENAILEKQMEENAKTITALRASAQEWKSHQQVQTAYRQTPERQMARPQSEIADRQETTTTLSSYPRFLPFKLRNLSKGFSVDNDARDQAQAPDSFVSKPDRGQGQVETLSEKTRHRQIDGHKATVNCVAISPDGTTVASGSQDKSVRIWDLATTKQVQELDCGYAVRRLAFSPDGAHLACSFWYAPIKILQIATGKQLLELKNRYHFHVCNAAFSPDGTMIASGFLNSVRIWAAATGKELLRVDTLNQRACNLAFSPDGTTIAAGTNLGTIFIWDAATGSQLHQIEHPYFDGRRACVRSVSFSPKGTTIASASGTAVRIWDIAKGKEVQQFDCPDGPFSMAFSPDGATIVSATHGNYVRIWGVATRRQLRQFLRPRDGIDNLALSPDGTIIACGSYEESIHMWDITAE